MLLYFENNGPDVLNKLMVFAKQNNIALSPVDESTNVALLGKPLTGEQLSKLITDGRKTSFIAMKNAHDLIRSAYNAD